MGLLTLRSLAPLIAAALFAATNAHAQVAAGIPPDQASTYRIDLAKHYFASPDAERAALATLDSVLARLDAFEGRLGQSPAALEQALQLGDAVRVELLRHSAYLALRGWADTRDASSAQRLQDLNARTILRTRFVTVEVRALNAATLARFYRERPSLRRYAFAIDEMRASPEPRLRLTEAEANLLQRVSPLVEQWQGEMYNRLFARRVDVQQDEDAYAYLLLSRARAGNLIASLRGAPVAAALAYRERHLSATDVRATTAALAARAELNTRYERARIAHVRRAVGRENILYYSDYLAPPAGDAVPRFTIAEARAVIERALAPLGAEYMEELRALLDPANGRLDIAPGPYRAPGAFTPATALGAGASVFYSSGFTGTFADVVSLAHEGGHAVQYELMRRAAVLPAYASGAPWLAESIAYFNELVLADHLYRTDTSPARQAFYLEQLVDREMQAISHARDVAFEEALYSGVARGTLGSAAGLNTLFDSIGTRYSAWHGLDPELKRHWIRIPHYFRAPFYRVNYMYGRLLAIRYFDMYRRDPSAFVPRFLALLRAGNSAPPNELLLQHLGIRMNGPALVADAAPLLEAHLAELEARYR